MYQQLQDRFLNSFFSSPTPAVSYCFKFIRNLLHVGSSVIPLLYSFFHPLLSCGGTIPFFRSPLNILYLDEDKRNSIFFIHLLALEEKSAAVQIGFPPFLRCCLFLSSRRRFVIILIKCFMVGEGVEIRGKEGRKMYMCVYAMIIA